MRDMRVATANAIFVDEDMVDLMNPQDNEDDSNDEEWLGHIRKQGDT